MTQDSTQKAPRSPTLPPAPAPLAVVHSRTLVALEAPEVRVEVQLAPGLPSFTLVGLADTEVKESRERVRAALQHSGLGFPHNRRITVNLAPADLPKDSGRFDLPIAVGVLAAAGLVDASQLARHEFAGELSLAGELRPVRGAVALALASKASGTGRTLVLPEDSARLAAQVPGLDVRSATDLATVVAALRAGPKAEPLPRAEPPPPRPAVRAPDLADVRGQTLAKRALEIAAAGGHSLLMVGPPGSGKSMLAQRLPGLLPALSVDEALAAAALRGLGSIAGEQTLHEGRPFRMPHHTASAAALVGGGSPPRPGEISLAHGGVLFLDELPEFPRSALEALREPLETGWVTLSRATRQATYPARFQLVAAMNPCPCGRLGQPGCRCSPDQVDRYRARLSGPLLDRIDLQLEVPAAPPAELMARGDGEASAVVALRVAEARARQLHRQGRLNAALDVADLDRHAALPPPAAQLLRTVAERLQWSGRRLHRCLKVARTLADLAGQEAVAADAVAEAIQWQRALPLAS